MVKFKDAVFTIAVQVGGDSAYLFEFHPTASKLTQARLHFLVDVIFTIALNVGAISLRFSLNLCPFIFSDVIGLFEFKSIYLQ